MSQMSQSSSNFFSPFLSPHSFVILKSFQSLLWDVRWALGSTTVALGATANMGLFEFGNFMELPYSSSVSGSQWFSSRQRQQVRFFYMAWETVARCR